jgi:endonuclease YncB( thermonuclease family)
MNARIWLASGVVALVAACSHIEPAEDMAQARYGKVVSTQALDGRKQRVVVRMGDGSTVDVTQERDSGILEGDVVRVLGTGSETRVRRL